jgi:hypothetical protein
MRLLSLVVENFRAIQSAELRFGRGLNVVYGPNDHGKSTLTEAIRATLLVAPGTAEARSFMTWGAAAGQLPKVTLGFESQGATWRVEKVFGQGSRARAQLDKSTDRGARYHIHAQGRDVEGKLRELLSWGLAAPGGRGASQRSETYLTTALLGKQGEVGAIFDATLKRDQDETGRALVTRALDALGQDPIVTRVLETLKERTGEAYTKTGRHKRGADSPLVRAQAALREREDRLQELQETVRQGKEIEEDIRRLLQERETALEERDQARAGLETLRRQQAAATRREQLQRDVRTLQALEAARLEHSNAQAALAGIANDCAQAVQAADTANAAARTTAERLTRARAAHESSEEVAAAARAARVSDLGAQLERASARRAAVRESESLLSQHATAEVVLDDARKEEARAAAEFNLVVALEELRQAVALTEAVTCAASSHERETERERVAAEAVSEADTGLKTATARLEHARNAEEVNRRSAEARAMNLQVLDTRIIHSEAAVRNETEALDRAKAAVLRVRRADEAQAAAAAAEAKAAGIEASLAANAVGIAQCEARLRTLESAALELRRRSAASKVDEWSAQEGVAREHRRRAADARDRAARIETEVAGVRVPSTQQLASLRALQAEIKGRRVGGPDAATPAVALVLFAGAASAGAGFAVARYGASAGTVASISAAVLLAVAAALIAAFASVAGRKRAAESSWRAGIEQLESRLAGETASVLSEASIRTLDEIEPQRQQSDSLRAEAARLRQEAAGLDREADSMFESTSGLSSARRDLEALTGQLASLSAVAIPPETLAGGWDTVNGNTTREQERLTEARRVRDSLRTERMSQSALCLLKRETAWSALYELGEVGDPEALVADAESRWREAQEKLATLRQERQHAADLSHASVVGVTESQLHDAEKEAALAESRLKDRRREHQDIVNALALATARLELARGEAKDIRLSEIEDRVAAARQSAGISVLVPDSDAARIGHEQAKARLAAALANAEILAAGIPEARRKAEALGSLASVEEDEGRLRAVLQEAETTVPATSFSAQELQKAEEAAGRAELRLKELREQAAAMTSKQTALAARVERAKGELEAWERQANGLDPEATQCALAGLEATPDVSAQEIRRAQFALESADAVLAASEGRVNEVRGKLALVAGRVGLERLDEEQVAVQRAKEYAEEQELDYEASRHLLELLEEVETKRSSHLGRCLAAPVTERFLALTGDLYTHVQLDSDLRMEGFLALGGTRQVEELSVGTREQLATIVRLAIAAQLKTAVILDDQLVHSDSERLEWFRKQLQDSVRMQDHQIIVMTCRLADYTVADEIMVHEGKSSRDGSGLTIINVLDVLRRLQR